MLQVTSLQAVEDSAANDLRPALTRDAISAPATCLHCGAIVPGAATEAYCCSGCRTIHRALQGSGLLRYYDLRGQVGEPAADLRLERRDRKWLEPIAEALRCSTWVSPLSFKVQGVRCAACVWLIQQLFSRQPGAGRIIVNPGRGTLDILAGPELPLFAFVAELEAFGYLVGPHGHRDTQQADDLLVRCGVCVALAGSAMMFAAAIYFGLHDGPLYLLLHGLNFGCATLAVLVGGPVFIKSAWQAVQRRLLHLDLPIAVGIVVTYGAALWSFISGNTRAAYYDTLTIFIALMLIGRWLKQRIVVRNQHQLLDSDGSENLLTRRIEQGQVRLTACHELRAGDELLIPAGDLVPVDARSLGSAALCSLDWINGESQPIAYAADSEIPAGAFNAGLSALRVRISTDFADSPLSLLLARPRPDQAQAPGRYHVFSAVYVLGVLSAALGGFVFWSWRAHDVVRGLEVATAICVVTCPCAIGIATPLAYDFVLSGLRRAGLFVRSGSFLDRALHIRRIVFDKTGTLTTGRLSLQDGTPLLQLSKTDRDVLYTLVAGSVHPKSLAVQHALDGSPTRLVDAIVSETPGQGVGLHLGDRDYRLGRTEFAASARAHTRPAPESSDDLVFAVDGQPLCTLRTCETQRSDARVEIAQLQRAGYETFILSGDEPARVAQLAAALGVAPDRATGGLSPAGKADWIVAHDRGDLLMIGDGINDSLAVGRAFASGTPSIDRALMPWRTDFYFTTPGLAPLGLSLRAARRLASVVRRNQVFDVGYNLAVVALSMLGLMRPWLAALLMPLSSIAVLTATSLSLSARSDLWKP
jgi:Cu2+-exporting ATPase